MEQWSSFRAKWRADKPGEADIALAKHGLVFKARVKSGDLITRGMLVALCGVSTKTITDWIKAGVIPVAKQARGVALFRVEDAYKVSRERGTL